jgi:preprotein translocase subunit YajC
VEREEGVFDHPGHRRADRGDHHKGLGWGKGLWGGGRHLDRLIHAEAVVDLPEKGLVTFSVDVGTVQSVADGSITIQPRQGAAVQLATNDDTKVRKDREQAGTDALATGDRVVVISSDETGSVVAKRILVGPAEAAD